MNESTAACMWACTEEPTRLVYDGGWWLPSCGGHARIMAKAGHRTRLIPSGGV